MLSINRYRLKHLAKQKNSAAKRVKKLLERPDRLLGVILICNTFANMLASSVCTMLALYGFGEKAVVPATLFLAIVVLIFAEIVPKTFAVLHPERLAFLASRVLVILLKVFYPLVWGANAISNGFLSLFNVYVEKKNAYKLSSEDIRTLVHETAPHLCAGYKHMMLGVLDLDGMTVDDVKIPNQDVVGIDLSQNMSDILSQLATCGHTRMPVYQAHMEQMAGILHLRRALNLAAAHKLTKESLLASLEKCYFIPEGTPLNVQLLNFRAQKKRMGFIVDEYGQIQGLVTLEDILEEIVGEFTTNLIPSHQLVHRQQDGSYLLDGGISIRTLNRKLSWDIPTSGPKTLSGLIVEYLETIPEGAVSLCLNNYRIEVITMEENTIAKLRISPMKQNAPCAE